MKKPLPDAALETPGPRDLSDEDVLTAMKGTFLAPNPLLKNFAALLLAKTWKARCWTWPAVRGENGLFLAGLGLPVIHYFEGLLENPPRAMAQIVCRKPF